MADNGGGWNAPETLGAYQGVLLVDQDEGGSDSMAFEIRCGVQQERALSPTDFNNIIHWILGQTLQDN